MPDHFISPTLFDSLDEYIELLESHEAFSSRNVVPETSPIISFAENAFAQFFENEVGSEITSFDERFKRRAARARYRKKDLPKQVRSLIVLFEQFCDIHDDVIGAGYGGQATVLEAFHGKLVLRLLERIRALAGFRQDSELRERAEAGLKRFGAAIADYDWSSP